MQEALGTHVVTLSVSRMSVSLSKSTNHMAGMANHVSCVMVRSVEIQSLSWWSDGLDFNESRGPHSLRNERDTPDRHVQSL